MADNVTDFDAYFREKRPEESRVPETSRFDSYFGDRDKSDTLGLSLRLGGESNPDQAAKAQTLAEEAQLPVPTVERNLGQVERQQATRKTQDALKNAPNTAAFMSNPDNAKVAHDDAENLSAFESILKGLSDSVDFKSFDATDTLVRAPAGEGVGTVGRSMRGIGELYGVAGRYLVRGLESVLPEGFVDAVNPEIPWWMSPSEILKRPGGEIADLGKDIGVPEDRQNTLTDITGGVGQIVGQIAVGLVSGPLGATQKTAQTIGMLGQGADILAEEGAQKEGATQESRDAAVLAGASVTAITERMGLDALLERVPPAIKNNVVRFVTDKVIAGGIEAGQEVVEGILHNITAMLTFDPEKEATEGLTREAIAAGGAGALFRTLLGAGKGGSGLINDRLKAVEAERTKQAIEAMGETAQASKLRERLPKKYREFVERVREAGPVDSVYVDAEVLQQSGVIDPLSEDIVDLPAKVSEALATGQPVAIPLEDYQTYIAGTDAHGALANDIKFHADDFTVNEADRFNAEVQDIFETEYNESLKAEAINREALAPADRIYDNIRTQLVAAGSTPDAAAQQAAIHKAHARVLQERYGVDPETVYGQFAVKGPIPESLSSPVEPMDLIIDRARRGAEDKKLFGTSLQDMARRLGIRDDRGDIASQDIDKGLKPFQRKMLRDDGVSLDDFAQQATDAGFFPGVERADVADVINALVGEDMFLPGDAVDPMAQAATDLTATLERLGVPLDATNEEIKAALANAESLDGGETLDQKAAPGAPSENMVEDGSGGIDFDGRAGDVLARTGNIEGFREINDEARDIVLDYGRKDGNEHLVIVNSETGDLVVAGTISKVNTVDFPRRFYSGLAAPDSGRHVAHHNHPSGRALSKADVSLMGTAALDAIFAHGHNGSITAAALTPAATQAGVQHYHIAAAYDRAAASVKRSLQKGVNSGDIPIDVANEKYQDLINRAMSGAGVIEYYTSIDPVDAPYYTKTLAAAERSAKNALKKQVPGFTPDQDHQPTVAIRAEGGVGVVLERSKAIAPARPADGGSGSQRGASTGGSPEVDPSGQYRLLENTAPATDSEAFAKWFGDSKVVDERATRPQRSLGANKAYREGLSPGTANERANSDGIDGERTSQRPATPLVVYHGTGQDVPAFSEGMSSGGVSAGRDYYFTDDPEVAASYSTGDRQLQDLFRKEDDAFDAALESDTPEAWAEVKAAKIATRSRLDVVRESGASGANVIPAYLSIQNPMIVDAEGRMFRNINGGNNNQGVIPNTKFKEGDDGEKMFMPDPRGKIPNRGINWYVEEAKRLGHDGLIVKNVIDTADHTQVENLKDGGGRTTYVAFNPTQIKSIHNRGTFDPADPRILFQPDGGGSRGNIQFFPDGRTIINFGQSADLSTFLHESGHMFVRSLSSLAGTNEQAAADLGAMMKFAGVESLDGFNETEPQEKMARAFEAYLREGNAPSVELQGTFARFRSWLLNIYRTLKGLNVEINEDIIGVFDRLLATDAEISEAEQVNSFIPLTGVQELMSDSEKAAYVKAAQEASDQAVFDLEKRKIAELTREETERWKAEFETVRAEIEQSVNNQPVYRLMDEIRSRDNGTYLSRGAVHDLVGADGARKLPGGLTRAEGGVHPDFLADEYGFSSGDEMLFALMNAAKNKTDRSAIVKEMAESRMKDRHGSLNDNTAQAAEAASEIVHNDERGKFLAMELKALSQGKAATPASVAKAAAKRLMATKKSSEAIQSGKYAAAEVKAAKDATRALLKGDIEAAHSAKLKQILNHYLFMESIKAREELDGMVRFFNRKRSKTIDPEYAEQIDGLLERYDFRKAVSLKAIEKRKSLAAFVAAQNEDDQPVSIPDALLNDARKQHYKDTTLEELRGLKDAVRHLEHLGRLKNRLLTDKAKRELNETVGEMVDSIESNWTGKFRKRTASLTPLEKTSEWWQRKASVRRIEFLMRELDGFKPGPMQERLFGMIADADDSLQERRHEAGNAIRDIFKPFKWREAKQLFSKKAYIPEINDSLTRESILAAALNTGNADNRAKLVKGLNWSEEGLDAVLRKMTKRDWDLVQGIWDYIDTFWPETVKLDMDTKGFAAPKVEAEPVETPFGTYRGGYYPLKYSTRDSDRANRNSTEDIYKRMVMGDIGRPSTNQGRTKERLAPTRGMQVRLDLGVFFEAIDETMHDLSFRKAAVDASKILNHPDLKNALKDTVGEPRVEMLTDWLKDSVAGDVAPIASPSDKVFAHVRKRTTIMAMGYKLSTALIQPLGYTMTVARFMQDSGAGAGLKYSLRGLREFYGSPKQKTAEVFAKSAFMRQRARTYDREVYDAVKNLKKGPLSYYEDSFFWHIAKMQLAVDMPTWVAAHEWSLDNQPEKGEAAAVKYADSVVRMTQGAGAAKDLAPIQKGGEGTRIFNMFMTFFSTMNNMILDEARMLKRNPTPAQIAQFSVNMFFMTVLPVVLETALYTAAGVDGPDDDESWGEFLGKKWVMFATGGLPGIRDVVSATVGDFPYEMSPVASTVKKAIGVTDQIAQGDNDRALWNSGLAAAGLISPAPLPTGQMMIMGDYFTDWFAGEKEGFNPVEAFVKRDYRK